MNINWWNNCRLCTKQDIHRPVFRYGIRHYCHAECGLKRWGNEFLTKIPRHEIGQIPFMELEKFPEAYKMAEAIMREERAQ